MNYATIMELYDKSMIAQKTENRPAIEAAHRISNGEDFPPAPPTISDRRWINMINSIVHRGPPKGM